MKTKNLFWRVFAILLIAQFAFGNAQVTLDNSSGGSPVTFTYSATDVTSSPNYTYTSFTYTVPAGQTHVFTESPEGFPNYIAVGHTVQINCTVSPGGGGVQTFSFTSGTTGGPFTISGSGPPPGHTNITVCVQNTTSGNVNAYWSCFGDNVDGGGSYQSETLGPGQTDCRTFSFTLPLDGSDNITSGFSPLSNNNGTVDPNSQNPFGTNADTATTFTNGSSGFGTTNTIVTGGGAAGNGGGGNTYNYSTNINYGVGGTNLALDSTLRSGFGQMHADNLNVINGESVLHNDNISLQNQFATITNELGQIVTYTYRAATNTDQLPTLISIVTNNASQNAASIKSAITSLPTTNTDIAAVNQLMMVNSNLVNLDNALTNQSESLTNIFASATDITNADLATETTQIGISNLLASMGTNGPFVDTNDPNYIANWTNSVTVIAPTNYAQALSQSATNTASYESSLATFVASITGFEQDDVNAAGDMTFYMGDFVGMGHTMVIDFNPLDNPDMADMFAHAKALWVWILSFIYLLKVAQDSVKAIELCNMARGGTGSSSTVKTQNLIES